MRTQQPKKSAAAGQKEQEKQKRYRDEAAADEALREQTRTEVEERPYLDTEGGD